MTDEEIEESTDVEVPIEDTELCVRYIGTDDLRTIGVCEWTPGSVVPYSDFEAMAGLPEQARQILQQHAHEFELVGPGAEDFEGEEEFSFGGPE